MSEVVSLAEYSREDAAPDDAARDRTTSAAGMTAMAPTRAGKPPPFFDRRELDQILNLYSMMVAAGEWRDYAIGQQSDGCSFDVFRRSCDVPLYRICKTPKLAKRQGAYSVVSAGGRILKRGHSLPAVLRLFDRSRFKVV